MTERIIVDFAVAEGAARRLLGLVERRGFTVTGIEMRAQPCGSQAFMALDLVPQVEGRRPDVLTRQLKRLHGVFSAAQADFGVEKVA